MLLAELAARYLSSSSISQRKEYFSDGQQNHNIDFGSESSRHSEVQMDQEVDLETARPPYIHAMLAGGLGGTTGDMLMHSIDTVKTRQQGDPHMPPKYTTLRSTYFTILGQEGIGRGLYGGVTPALVGSFGGTVIFFGSYEWSKRRMLDWGISPWISYLSAGIIADIAASPLYVPSEVLKTRLQLQGRYNNPFFNSGYNYRGTIHALRSIYRLEGMGALFYGYKATLYRDVPFSALQFAFYEQERKFAKSMVGSRDLGLGLEIFTGASAGCMAGILTCPLDVVKTRIQTQHNPSDEPSHLSSKSSSYTQPSTKSTTTTATRHTKTSSSSSSSSSTSTSPSSLTSHQSIRPISTSSPSTSLRPHSAAMLDTSSVITGLRVIYQTEGIAGWFRGVGPRAVWTSVQSGTMLVLYQTILRWFERHPLVDIDDP